MTLSRLLGPAFLIVATNSGVFSVDESDFEVLWRHGDAEDALERRQVVGVLREEVEPLHHAANDQVELHAGQSLAHTDPSPCNREQKQEIIGQSFMVLFF